MNFYKALFSLILISQSLGFLIQLGPGLSETSLKYNGTGFTKDLQDVFHEAIVDSSIFYKAKTEIQTWYIKDKLEKKKSGTWNVFTITNLTISKITDVSIGFYYYTSGEVWALWYNTSAYSPSTLHIALYNGPEHKAEVNITSKSEEKGSAVSSQLKSVIDSIVETLDSTQDIAQYIEKFDKRDWSVLSFPAEENNEKPKVHACLDVDDVWVYEKEVTLSGRQYSQILYV